MPFAKNDRMPSRLPRGMLRSLAIVVACGGLDVAGRARRHRLQIIAMSFACAKSFACSAVFVFAGALRLGINDGRKVEGVRGCCVCVVFVFFWRDRRPDGDSVYETTAQY